MEFLAAEPRQGVAVGGRYDAGYRDHLGPDQHSVSIRAPNHGCCSGAIRGSERANFTGRGIAMPSQSSVKLNGELGCLFALGLQTGRSGANDNRRRGERDYD